MTTHGTGAARRAADAARTGFHAELDAAEAALVAEAVLVGEQLERVVEALVRRDASLARDVVARDDLVDDVYLATDARVLQLLALQAPVAGDLRRVSAILHSNVHLERMGDLCVNIAKFVLEGSPYPPGSPMIERLRRMAACGGDMLSLALSALARRDARLAEELPARDDEIDRLNRGILDDLKRYVENDESFEWATKLVLVARYLERFGDHAVDIGEQVAFVTTGVFREFTDASHPVGPRREAGR